MENVTNQQNHFINNNKRKTDNDSFIIKFKLWLII